MTVPNFYKSIHKRLLPSRQKTTDVHEEIMKEKISISEGLERKHL